MKIAKQTGRERNYMQRKLQKLEAKARKTFLKIDVKKTKTLRNRNGQII
jgi:hypothetical protein